jgi:hypothetical protein
MYPTTTELIQHLTMCRASPAEFSLWRFAPITYEHYGSEEQALRNCEGVLSIRLR